MLADIERMVVVSLLIVGKHPWVSSISFFARIQLLWQVSCLLYEPSSALVIYLLGAPFPQSMGYRPLIHPICERFGVRDTRQRPCSSPHMLCEASRGKQVDLILPLHVETGLVCGADLESQYLQPKGISAQPESSRMAIMAELIADVICRCRCSSFTSTVRP
jgi:hypothetical protein